MSAELGLNLSSGFGHLEFLDASKRPDKAGHSNDREGRGGIGGRVTQQLRIPTLHNMPRNPAGMRVQGLSTRQPGGIKTLTPVVLGVSTFQS